MSKRFNWYAFRCDLARVVGTTITDHGARLVRRRMARLQTLAEQACNRELTAREIAEDATRESRLRAFFGDALESFNGDPRGYVVKLRPWRPGNPRYDAHTAEWPDDTRLAYFEHDWGGSLVFTGGK